MSATSILTPPFARALMLTGLSTLLSLSLVACAPAQPEDKPDVSVPVPASPPTIQMEVQHYDSVGNMFEIPSLVPAGGEELSQELQDFNDTMLVLAEKFRPVIEDSTTVWGNSRCLFYPSTTEQFLNLILYQDLSSNGNDETISTLVYDLEQSRPVTTQEALDLAEITEEALLSGLAEVAESNSNYTSTSSEHSILGFRICPSGTPEFYLQCTVAQVPDPNGGDIVTPEKQLYIFANGVYIRYRSYPPQPLIPAEETDSFATPLWNQWYFAGDLPTGGFPWPQGDLQQLLIAQADTYNGDYAMQESGILHASSGENATLLLCYYTPGNHMAGLDNLLLGTFDLDGNLQAHYEIFGDDARWSHWGSKNNLYLLCSNSTFNHGEESFNGAFLFHFDGSELTLITDLPEVAQGAGFDLLQAPLFLGNEGILNPAEANQEPAAEQTDDAQTDDTQTGDAQTPIYDHASEFWGFWQDRKILPAPQGAELFVRTDGWDNIDLEEKGLPQWTYVGFLPFTEQATQSRPVIEALRSHLEAQSLNTGTRPNSANYQVIGLEQIPDYTCGDHPDAIAWQCTISDENRETFGRVVLTDAESKEVVGIHSDAAFSLKIDGVAYSLGYEDESLFGRPYRSYYSNIDPSTNVFPRGVTMEYYSKLFGLDMSVACGFIHYPDTEAYRLASLSSRELDSTTDRGIHPGSTLGELYAAYPSLKDDSGLYPSELTFYEAGTRGCQIVFYPNWTSAPSNAPVEDYTILEICISYPDWYDRDCA